MNVPNTITWGRIFLTGIIVTFMIFEKYQTAFILFLIAALSDYADGYFARKLNQVTTFGKVFDQMSDKILITSVMIIMVEKSFLPGWIVVTIVFRDTIVSAVRMTASTTGKVIAANYFGKIKTVFQMALVIGIFLQMGNLGDFYMLNTILEYVVVFFTILSGFIYVYQNRSVLKG
ncbi:CDP-diacylglycerol--glycerol-3-phosphate 3-phosphatidyltransferase [Thermosipho ferrireducens]|uniref:CDP-diacylglycerol--glycerol-3-phosphate 3-phosphatidyltransferase n=1 Tax=Thermosipho ferrireducens TaxID=2571116 RepID=A0ABX7S905_9BACT|nr:CDP-diacylglycerol--glycerol-3-phosphate 3-phosphatidyltransferase [Thermosipho ferrireducens]QTA38147.1 CDP-diacylglycerol--glycerol-3-phosphate 3-phosphatidyltransferase [Thermosipho ferrireducens]